MDKRKPANSSYSNLIEHVKDRPGHDRRYSIDSSKINKELGWKSNFKLEESIEKTVNWYLDNHSWVKKIQEKSINFMELVIMIKVQQQQQQVHHGKNRLPRL